jgi:NTE family protein
LVEAILASAAIPGVLPSVDWHGRQLIDGGVANNTPISHAIDLGAKRIFVLPTVQTCELEAVPSSALGMIIHATNLLVHRRLADDIVRFRDVAELIVLPPPCPVRVQPMDFGHGEVLIAAAITESRAFLDAWNGEASATPVSPELALGA